MYLKDVASDFHFLLENTEIDARLPDKELLHVYCVAGSQSGKTEFLKLCAYAMLSRPEPLIFIEPAGDASRQIAMWKEAPDRLIYVDHSLQYGRTPTINPFEIYGIAASDTSPKALAVKKVVAQQLLEAFQEVIATGEGSELSKNMQTVLMQCLLVLLDYEGATIRDLHRFMDKDRNADLLAFAKTRHHYPDVSDFFAHGFHRETLKMTKSAIQNKLQDLFSTGNFADLTCGKCTISLEQAIEERKIIIFNLAKGSVGEREGTAFGRLIVAMLQGIAMRRAAQGNRVPVRVIIDECHNYVTKSVQTIITEAAKFKLFLTMAQQFIGQGMGQEMKQSVLGVGVQIAGRNANAHHSSVASMLGVQSEDIAALDRGEFIIHLAGVKPFKFRIHTHLLGWSNSMSESAWERVKADQLKRYYRTIATTRIAPRAGLVDTGAAPPEPPAKQPSGPESTAPQKPVPHDPFNIDRV